MRRDFELSDKQVKLKDILRPLAMVIEDLHNDNLERYMEKYPAVHEKTVAGLREFGISEEDIKKYIKEAYEIWCYFEGTSTYKRMRIKMFTDAIRKDPTILDGFKTISIKI